MATMKILTLPVPFPTPFPYISRKIPPKKQPTDHISPSPPTPLLLAAMNLSIKSSERKNLKASKRCLRSKISISKRFTPCSKKRGSLGGGKRGSMAAKLVALRALISADSATKADQLFDETAQHIILLKTQVMVLQKLVEFYSKGEEKLMS